MPPNKRLTAAQRAAEAAAARQRSRILAVSAIGAGLLVLVVALVMILNRPPAEPTPSAVLTQAASPAAEPPPAQSPVPAEPIPVTAPGNTVATNGAVLIGAGGVPTTTPNPDVPTVTVYSDFLCHWCKLFEETHGASLVQQAAAGEINLEYVLVAILHTGPTGYSTRTSAAAYLVAEQAPEAFWGFVQALMANQPTTAEQIPDDAALAALATQAGVPAEVAAQFASGAYLDFTAAVTNTAAAYATNFPQALPNGLATPFVLIDGQPSNSNWTQPGAFEAEVAAAK